MQAKSIKILVLLWACCLHPGTAAQPVGALVRADSGLTHKDSVGLRVVQQAKKDVGYQEFTNRNDHPIYSYYRKIGGSSDVRGVYKYSAYLPTCGFAVNAWHIQAGVKPKNAAPGVARAWMHRPRGERIKLGAHTTAAAVAKLRPGMVLEMGFRYNRRTQYHVGIIKEAYPIYGRTIEANTSTKGAYGTYSSKTYGVIEKRRFWATAIEADDWRGSASIDSLPALRLRTKYLNRLR